MLFPDVERKIYQLNPLDQVVCQFRFHPILRIESEIPVKFQEAIREDFPILNDAINIQQKEISNSIIPKEIIEKFNKIDRSYEFSSIDKKWVVTLNRTSLSLICNDYKRWEDFYKMFKKPLDALMEIYSPKQIVRVGLRYVNVIRRSQLELVDCNWNDLLKPAILGLLGENSFSKNIDNFSIVNELQLNDDCDKVTIRTKFVKHITEDEYCIMIDNDFFSTQHITSKEAVEKIELFNKEASKVIRWCISQKLHDAMLPEDYE